MIFENMVMDLCRALLFEDVEMVRKILIHPVFSNCCKCSKLCLELASVKVSEAAMFCMDNKIIELLITFFKDGIERNLLLAILRGDVHSVELILRNCAALPEQLLMKELLFYEIVLFRRSSTRKQMLKLLLRYGLDTSYKNVNGQNLLHQFINYTRNRHEDVVEVAKILVNSGVLVNEVDNDGYSALLLATLSENEPLITFLVKQGSDVNRKSKYGEFPLYNAVEAGNLDVINLLLSNGADINAQNAGEFGETALHRACFWNHHHVISLLIQRGADVSAVDKSGRTPLSRLNPEIKNYDDSLVVLVKELSKLSFEGDPAAVSSVDASLIQTNPKAKKHFEGCMAELQLMSSTKFYGSHSYRSVLKKSKNIEKFALLTRNEKLVSNFEPNLSQFTYYQDDLRQILNEAVRARNDLDAIESSLYCAFGNHYPSVVIRKLAKHLTVDDLP